MSSFLMNCPECDVEFDVEFTATGSRMREEFWGAPVSWDETEIEFETRKCPDCGHELDYDELADRAEKVLA